MATITAEQLVEKMIGYGVQFEGDVVAPTYHDGVDYANQMTLREVSEKGGRITRVRILTGRWAGVRMADISYIHATLPGGKIVPVYVGVGNGIPLRQLKGEFIKWAQSERVFAKGLGLLDESNWSILHGE